MSDKLEALSQPVAHDYQIALACIADGHNENGKWVDWRTELSRDCPPDWMIEEGKVKDLKPLYSQEYVTALLAALEEKDRQAERLQKTIDSIQHPIAQDQERIAELQQRLQQPIKLPERYSVDCGVVCDPSGDWLSLDEMVKVLGDAGLEVRSPCPRCNRLLDLTSRPDGAHYCHHKVEGE